MTDIISTNITDEMKQAYGDYAMAVLIGRAIPDLYDGLKPVTRRVLTAMKWLNLKPDARFMKAARVEGETMGKLHPHGGAYGAMVTAASWWTNNHPLINGHGNWGSPTDGPAAARYTEAKLTEYAYSVLLQDSDTWVTRPNYDGSLQEPVQLNARVPNVLLNGGEGIGVGYATRIPTHNLRGVAKAMRFMVEGDVKNAAKHLVPDFPTGCDVVKDEGLLEYINTGHGSIRMRAKCEQFEADWGKRSKRTAFTFTNLPLHANTEQVGDQIKDALEKGKITTVADVRDETDRTGVRLVVVCKANVDPEQAQLEIFKHTSLDCKFSASNLVIDGSKPVQLNPFDILKRWLEWRDGRFVEAIQADLDSTRGRLEVVKGLVSALAMIDEVIDTIRHSKDRADARTKLVKRDFTEVQANAILDMRLAQLTKLDATTLKTEAKELQAKIKELVKLNSNKGLRSEHLLEEIDEIATRHGNTRRSKAIEPPKELNVQIVKQGRKSVAVKGPKPRFVKVDEKLGVLAQDRKLSRGTWVVQSDEKMVFVCDNGKFMKVGAHHKGPLCNNPTEVLAKARTGALPSQPLIVVYKIDDSVYANALSWESLTKCTSKGKIWLPDGAELIHFGDSYTLEMKGRRKDKVVSSDTIKARPVGGKGNKIAKVIDTSMG